MDGHSESVNSVSYSPDGKFIVSGSHDESIRIWSSSSGEMIQKVLDCCDVALLMIVSYVMLSVIVVLCESFIIS